METEPQIETELPECTVCMMDIEEDEQYKSGCMHPYCDMCASVIKKHNKKKFNNQKGFECLLCEPVKFSKYGKKKKGNPNNKYGDNRVRY